MCRDLAGRQSHFLAAGKLAWDIILQPLALACADNDAAAQIRHPKRGGPVAAIGRAEQLVQRGVVGDLQQLPVAQCPTQGCKVEADSDNLPNKRLAHASVSSPMAEP